MKLKGEEQINRAEGKCLEIKWAINWTFSHLLSLKHRNDNKTTDFFKIKNWIFPFFFIKAPILLNLTSSWVADTV